MNNENNAANAAVVLMARLATKAKFFFGDVMVFLFILLMVMYFVFGGESSIFNSIPKFWAWLVLLYDF